MKPGLNVGQSAEVEIEITKDMLATLAGETIHELYATSSLVQHMELAGRKLIVPFLEDHEEGMGSHVEVSHLALTLPGMRVKVKATVTEIRDKKVVCDVEAYNTRGKIARGTVTQSIVEKAWLDRKMKELSIIINLSDQQFNASPNTK
jgi:predicted thioesterase